MSKECENVKASSFDNHTLKGKGNAFQKVKKMSKECENAESCSKTRVMLFFQKMTKFQKSSNAEA
jgi:hypothetical protein